MKKMMKTLSACLVLVLMLGCLASCAATPESVLEQADRALTSSAYTCTVEMSFSCDDPTMDAAFDSMENMDVSVTYDGGNVLSKSAMTMDYSGYTMNVTAEMLVIGDTLYSKTAVSLLGESEVQKMKATLSAEEKESLMGDIGESSSTGDVQPSDFETLAMEKKDGETVVTCTGLSAAAKDKILEIMESSVGSMASVDVSDVQLTCVIKDKKYDKATLSCVYAVTVAGTTYEIESEIVVTYDYAADIKVEAPADANTYEESTYDEIMGGGIG